MYKNNNYFYIFIYFTLLSEFLRKIEDNGISAILDNLDYLN